MSRGTLGAAFLLGPKTKMEKALLWFVGCSAALFSAALFGALATAILIVFAVAAGLIYLGRQGRPSPSAPDAPPVDDPPVLIKTYTGRQANATALFQADLAKMVAQGYFPVSQNYIYGAYTAGEIIFVILLCTVFIGWFIVLYMLIVKRPGSLFVTYELRSHRLEARSLSPKSLLVLPA